LDVLCHHEPGDTSADAKARDAGTEFDDLTGRIATEDRG
jgi:hypothetical protein